MLSIGVFAQGVMTNKEVSIQNDTNLQETFETKNKQNTIGDLSLTELKIKQLSPEDIP